MVKGAHDSHVTIDVDACIVEDGGEFGESEERVVRAILHKGNKTTGEIL